jgi:pimeloyl-ACP methyl ester carboxylesterase
VVPLDRSHPDAGDAHLAVMILHSPDLDPLPDPIVYFSGGPGDKGLSVAERFASGDYGGSARDIILFDQRGTGSSQPSLDCPEATDLLRSTLGAADPLDVERVANIAMLRACRARLVAEGIDLDLFNTSTTADDADDLRRALNIEKWNLFGVSYGTTVALEVARRHPDAVRSVVIDSAYPPDIPTGGVRFVSNGARAIRTLLDGCAADHGCAAEYPTLEANVRALVAEWNAQPFVTTITDPTTNAPMAVAITGSDVISGLQQALYVTSLIPALPSFIAPLRERGDVAKALIGQFVGMAIQAQEDSSEGVFVGVDCADRQRLVEDPSDIDEVLAEFPEMEALLSSGECKAWDVASVDKSFNKQVRADLPLLALAGEYDPITPPQDTRNAANGFAVSTFVQFPALGHGVTFDHDCPRSIMRAFITDPNAPVDDSCVSEMGPPAFVGG